MATKDILKHLNAQVVYKGFDTLDVAFKGCFPQNVLEKLENAKLKAQNNNESCLVKINGIAIKVNLSGAKEGYKYIFDSGFDGETWFVKHSVDPEQWNIRVSIKSATLAEHGFNGAKDRLYKRFEKFGATILEESIGRIDFAVDIKAPDFILNPEGFVYHSRTTVNLRGEAEEVEDALFNFSMSGRKFSGVTIGKNPNKQVIIYDKRKEVIAEKKHYWWDYWGLDKDNKENRVWRIELRAYKRHLKETWDIRTWQDLEHKIGDVYLDMIQATRMVIPDSATRIENAKLHPFWAAMNEIVKDVFAENINGCCKGRVVQVEREKLKDCFRDQMAGLAVGYAYLNNISIKNIDVVINRVRHDLERFFRTGKEKIVEKYDRAMNRYYFTDERYMPCLA